MRLSNLVNIGPRMEEMLIKSGITDVDQLKELGAAEAAFKVRQAYPETSIRLTALEGALRGTRWHNISDEDRVELELAYNALCDNC